MFGLIKRAFRNDKSKAMAKSRLHFVLVQDRSGLSNQEMANFKQDMVDVIKRYFIIDDAGVEVEYQRDSGSTTLLINSPVLRRKAGAVSSNGASPNSGEKKKKVERPAQANA